MDGSDRDGSYIHGSSPEEQQRLSLLNELLNEGSLGALALAGGESILDVGSGLGQLARAMARQAGAAGRVVGVERDGGQLAEALRQAAAAGETGLVDFRRGSVAELPLAPEEWGTFDVAHARFVLEHVPDPDAVVATMARVVRPGGRIVLEDDDHDLLRLWPEPPGFDRVWRAYVATYDRLGNDPYVGRRLAAMLAAAGAEVVRTDMLFFGSNAGRPSFEPLVANLAGLIAGAADEIASAGVVDRPELDRALAALEEWGARRDAAMWFTRCWAEGRRPRRQGAPQPPAPAAGPAAAGRPRRKVSSLELLTASAADLSSSLKLDDVFRKIAERVGQLIECHLFCVMLYDEERRMLEHSYSLRFGEHVPLEGGFPLGYGISGSAAELRRPVRVDDVAGDPRYVRFRHAEVEIRSELAVPLVVRDRLVGVLDLESVEPAAFSAEHEQIIVALASQIATALDNARLYEDVLAQETRLAEDLRTAREIQRGLLPPASPALEGFEVGAAFAAARELSGDFYDFLPLDGGRLAVALGDVAGKSTAAALYGSLAVGMLRSRALVGGDSPGEMLDRLNEQLCGVSIERRFVALQLVVLDPATRRLRIANAGVPAPRRIRGGEIVALDVAGLPLGSMERGRHPEIEIELAPGELLVIGSDGIEDCRNASGETFGERELAAALRAAAGASAREVADRLVAESRRFAAAGHDDDRTVVVIRSVASGGERPQEEA